MGDGFGPDTVECDDGTFDGLSDACETTGSTVVGGPLLLYLQHGRTTNTQSLDASGFSDIANQDYSLFAQDTFKITRNLTLNYGLRWDAQIFPDPVVAPSQTSYGQYLGDPAFPSTGKLPNQNKEFQPRVGFAWDITGKGKSVLRASYGIFFARQNMLTQVGAITTNGVQQQEIAAGTFFNTANPGAAPPPPTYPVT